MVRFCQQQERGYGIGMAGRLPQAQKINEVARRDSMKGSRELIYRENYNAVPRHLELEKAAVLVMVSTLWKAHSDTLNNDFLYPELALTSGTLQALFRLFLTMSEK